jgi:uncharacterized membrane protein
MDNRNFFKPNIILPIIIGITIGSILFLLGEADDAPGLCVIGIVLCIGLLYWGLHNANKINKHIKPSIVLPLLIGIVGIICIIKYFINGIFDEPPGLILMGLIGSIGLIISSFINIIKKKKEDIEKIKDTI